MGKLNTGMGFKLGNDAFTTWLVAIPGENEVGFDFEYKAAGSVSSFLSPPSAQEPFFRALVSPEKITPCMAWAPSPLPASRQI